MTQLWLQASPLEARCGQGQTCSGDRHRDSPLTVTSGDLLQLLREPESHCLVSP